MVWACIEKRRQIRRQESDGDGGAGEKKERKTEVVVVGSRTTCRRENCPRRKSKTELNEGIS